MHLPEFKYEKPSSLQQAVAILGAAGEQAAVLGGGTDLLISMKMRLRAPAILVAVRGLPELAGIGVDDAGTLRIGAGMLLTDLAEHPLIASRYPGLAQAIRSVGSRHIRNMATLGGNLSLPTRCWYTNQSENWRGSRSPCWKTEGALCHVIKTSTTCRAVNSADSATALITLDARVQLRGPQGGREVPLAGFYRDDGVNHNALAPGEIITAVLVPAAPARSAFIKAAARTGLDYGYGTLAAAMTGGNRAPKRAVLVAGSLGSWPIVLRKAGQIILEGGLTEESIAAAADAARDDLGEVTNLFSPPGYKKRLVRGLVRRVLGEIRCQQIPGA